MDDDERTPDRFRELPEPLALEQLVAVKPVSWPAVAAAPLPVGLGGLVAGGSASDVDGGE